MAYRISRNIEASIIQFLQDKFNEDWSGINVEKTFARIYELSLPSVCIRCGVTTHVKAEVGGDSTIRTAQVLVDIFAKDDGQRLDMKDYIIRKIKGGLPYYEYTIVNGQIQSKIQNGRIRVIDIDDTPLEFDVDKDRLDVRDRYRHLLTLSISLGKIEE